MIEFNDKINWDIASQYQKMSDKLTIYTHTLKIYEVFLLLYTLFLFNNIDNFIAIMIQYCY